MFYLIHWLDPIYFRNTILEYLLYNLQVCGRKVAFIELPAIDDVSIQNQELWRDAFKILNELTGMTPIGPEVNIT